MEINEQQRQDGLYRDDPALVESGYVEEGAAVEARLDTRKTKEAFALDKPRRNHSRARIGQQKKTP
jgi:hypothetical protein